MKPDLKRGDRGPDVAELQDLINRHGLLLVCDGAFGPGTEAAVREVQALAGLPATGTSDAALWTWLEAQPEPDPRFSTEGVTFVCREEVGGRSFYDSHAATPHWPGGESGVTLGMGYDLRFQSESQFEADWGDVLDADDMADLRPWLGAQGSADAVAGLQHIRIPITAAWRVYLKRSVPRYWELTLEAYPEAQDLSPLCRAVLLSLVYNRGNSLSASKDSRREMRAIRDCLRDGDLPGVAAQIRAMKRLWAGNAGLQGRRDREAELWERGLAEA